MLTGLNTNDTERGGRPNHEPGIMVKLLFSFLSFNLVQLGSMEVG
jgi:hypothetical protein